MTDVVHPIRVVARRTGLSAHVIRIWEQRYQAVEPERTPTRRRLYSPGDIERLRLLRDLTRAGHSIGQVANLPSGKLRELAVEAAGAEPPASRLRARAPAKLSVLDECLAAVQSFDAPALDAALQRGGVALGALGLLERVVGPLVQSLGDLWRQGALTAAHEHFATGVLRVFLGQAAKPFGAMEDAPMLVVATPSGQVHELGALLAGATAANLGWRVTYLGASLPAAEIAGAAHASRARAIALSLVYPEDDPRLESELTRLRTAAPTGVALLVGGRAAAAYLGVLSRLGAVLIEDLNQLGLALDRTRRPSNPGN